MGLRSSRMTPGFRWNPALRHGAGGYIGADGRAVAATEVRRAIDRYLEANGRRMAEVSGQLQRGEIALSTWQRAMHRAIANTHMAAAAASVGGWAQMTPRDRGHAAQLIKQELHGLKKWAQQSRSGKRGGLQQFAVDIENGLPLDGRFMQRTRMYAQAARHTYEESRRRRMDEAGMTQAKSIRHAQDSCDGCITQAALGWQPLAELIPIGERDCLRNCKCTVEYRTQNPDKRIDALVKKVQSGRQLSGSEINELSKRVSEAGFETRSYQRIRRKDRLAGVRYRGRRLQVGDRIPVDEFHYLKHVVVQNEWPQDTTKQEYIGDIKRIILDPHSDILYSEYLGMPQISFVGKSRLRGSGGGVWTIVDYRIATKSWVTAFQPEGLGAWQTHGRSDARWVRRVVESERRVSSPGDG